MAFLVFGLNLGDQMISVARVIPDEEHPGMSRYVFDRPATPEECAWVRAQGPPPERGS